MGQITNFNTSHVNVNRLRVKNYIKLNKNFNTSHVNVNQKPVIDSYLIEKFQYISC